MNVQAITTGVDPTVVIATIPESLFDGSGFSMYAYTADEAALLRNCTVRVIFAPILQADELGFNSGSYLIGSHIDFL